MAFWTIPDAKELKEFCRWDSEAFSPVLRLLDTKLESSPKLSELASVTHPAEIPRIYSGAKDGPLFILAQNIRPLLLETSTEFHIARATADEIPANRLRHADVLVTRTGANSGTCAVYLGGDGKCYTSGEGIIVRSRGDIEGAYLATYLNTTTGQAYCRRAIYGSGQPHIGPKYLELTRIPRLGKVEEQSSSLVRSAYSELKAIETLYPEAEAELLDRLGLAKLQQQSMELSYVRDFTDITIAGRADAEFFRPESCRIRDWLRQNHAMSVGEICHFVQHGLQPTYVKGGAVGIVSQRQFRTTGLALDLLENFTNEQFLSDNPQFRLQKGDVLTYCVSAGDYLGRTFVFDSDIPCVAASFVTILRTQQVVPGYLALFLNSPAGLIQSNMFKRGTSPFYLYPRDLRQVLIFIPRQRNGTVDLTWQEALAAKVKAAGEVKAAARAKLEEAIRLVEEAIRN